MPRCTASARKACVLHAHMPYATSLTLTAGSALVTTLSQNSMRFYGRSPMTDYNGLALDEREGARIANGMVWATSSSWPTTGWWYAATGSPTRSTTSTTSSAPAWCRSCARPPAGRYVPVDAGAGAPAWPSSRYAERLQSELFFEALRRTLR